MAHQHIQHGTKRKMLAETIERQTKRKLTIDATDTPSSLAKTHPQTQSPLFDLLPREIRDLIWAYATSPSKDSDRAYATNEHYYRPGHTAPWKSDTNLLLTCRRIWLEANPWPMLQAEHCFWYYRAAPDGRDARWMARLTPLNRRNFGHVHLFAQMYAIEGLRSREGNLRRKFFEHPHDNGEMQLTSADFQPWCFHVTIRHTDWWSWESEAPLRFEDSWMQALLDTPDLRSTRVLKLELETLDYKVVQMMPIVARLEALQSREFETHVVDGRPVTTKFVLEPQREVYDWTGPTNIGNGTFGPYRGKTTLKYHVVMLTWKLVFPELPNAHIPTLRLAPRAEIQHEDELEDQSDFDDQWAEQEDFEWYGGNFQWNSSQVEAGDAGVDVDDAANGEGDAASGGHASHVTEVEDESQEIAFAGQLGHEEQDFDVQSELDDDASSDRDLEETTESAAMDEQATTEEMSEPVDQLTQQELQQQATQVRTASQYLDRRRFDAVRERFIETTETVVSEMWKDEWEEKWQRQNSLLRFVA